MGRAVVVETLLAGLRDASGRPLANGKVYAYEPGTLIKRDIYSTLDKTGIINQPLILSAQGNGTAYADGLYRIVVKDVSGATIYDWDNLPFVFADSLTEYGATSTGAANTYAVTIAPPIQAYEPGRTIRFRAHQSNTSTTPTLNVNSLGPITLKDATGAALNVGAIIVGRCYQATYSSAPNIFLLNDSPLVTPTPQMFGAKGDGINDDTAAIQAAITFASAAKTYLYFSPGTYKISSGLTSTDLNIRGVPGCSIIKPTSAVAIAWHFTSSTYATSGCPYRTSIDGLTFDGSDTSGKLGIKCGTPLAPLASTTFKNVTVAAFTGTSGAGIYIDALVFCKFDSCTVGKCQTNVRINTSDAVNSFPVGANFVNCWLASSVGHNVWISSGGIIKFEQCAVELSQQTNLYVDAAAGTIDQLTIIDCDFERAWQGDAGQVNKFGIILQKTGAFHIRNARIANIEFGPATEKLIYVKDVIKVTMDGIDTNRVGGISIEAPNEYYECTFTNLSRDRRWDLNIVEDGNALVNYGVKEDITKTVFTTNLSQPYPIYANNAAAIAGGLKAGGLFRTGADPDIICVVH